MEYLHNVMVKIHNKSKVLSFLLSNKKEEFTIRAISKNVSVDYKTVYLIIKELTKIKLFKPKKLDRLFYAQ